MREKTDLNSIAVYASKKRIGDVHALVKEHAKKLFPDVIMVNYDWWLYLSRGSDVISDEDGISLVTPFGHIPIKYDEECKIPEVWTL